MAGSKISMQDILSKIEGVVKQMTTGFTKTQESLDTLTSKVTDLTASVEMAHQLVQEVKQELSVEKQERVKLCDKVATLEAVNMNLKVEISKLKERAIDNENRNRRNCLEIEGFAQDPGENTESLEAKLMSLFQSKLNLDIDKIHIERCHRFGSSGPGRPRPVIVRFLSYQMRKLVWINRKQLKGSNIYINESFAPEVKERRRILWPYIKCARRLRTKAYLAIDKAVIADITYKYDQIGDIPDVYRPSHTRTTEEAVLFFTKNSPLSNFYKCSFTIDNVDYTSVEQYFAVKAATHFNDKDTADLIMQQSDAAEHKRSSRQIKGYNKAVWYQDAAPKAMKDAMHAKFSQNQQLCQFLKNTQDKIIGEANPSDRYWGIGLSLWSDNAINTTMWNGDNHAGKLLMEVRAML